MYKPCGQLVIKTKYKGTEFSKVKEGIFCRCKSSDIIQSKLNNHARSGV
jgi:hypothetical protein